MQCNLRVLLLAIVLVFTITLGSRKLGEQEGRLLKLASGLMMRGLGVMLLLAPKALNQVSAAVLLLSTALLSPAWQLSLEWWRQTQT